MEILNQEKKEMFLTILKSIEKEVKNMSIEKYDVAQSQDGSKVAICITFASDTNSNLAGEYTHYDYKIYVLEFNDNECNTPTKHSVIEGFNNKNELPSCLTVSNDGIVIVSGYKLLKSVKEYTVGKEPIVLTELIHDDIFIKSLEIKYKHKEDINSQNKDKDSLDNEISLLDYFKFNLHIGETYDELNHNHSYILYDFRLDKNHKCIHENLILRSNEMLAISTNSETKINVEVTVNYK